jgi:nitrite reductase (NO-forming)
MHNFGCFVLLCFRNITAMKKTAIALFFWACITGVYSCGSHKDEGKPAFTVEDTHAPKVPGEDTYKRTCGTCHQSTGEGIAGVYPPLAKSDFLADKEKVINQVIKGHSGEMTVNGKKFNNTMPPQKLDDQEVADVLTYVYSSFGNTGGPVTADEVKAERAKAQ